MPTSAAPFAPPPLRTRPTLGRLAVIVTENRETMTMQIILLILTYS